MMKKLLAVLSGIVLACACSLNTWGQNIVQSDSILYPLHKTNVGVIAFMQNVIPIESFTEADFLRFVELREARDLNIRVFMANSLTNYLHQLAPQLSVAELCAKGNYQFSFIIDGKKLYTENLHPGAGSPESKNRRTVFRVPFISSTNEDSWGRFLWNRFLAHGGEEALMGGEHLMKIEIRPYITTSEVMVGQLIAQGQIQIRLREKAYTAEQIALQSIKASSGWEHSSDAIDTALIMELNKKIITERYKDITSIVVIKNGKLLLEEYFNGASRNSLHDTRSVGKSFASAMTGIAIRDKYLHSEQQKLSDFYSAKDDTSFSAMKTAIRLKELLTMTSALDCSDRNADSPGNEEFMYSSPDWVRFALHLPTDSSKSTLPRWDYCTAGVIILGDILQKSLPGGLESYAQKTLFKPLGIRLYTWQQTPQQVANTAGGLCLRSLDYAKFGQLYKNQGQWKGKQILPRTWVESSLSPQVAIPDEGYYGYLFWNKTYTIKGKDYELSYASGNGGNRIIIVLNQPIVIVITATAYNKAYAHTQADTIVQDYLIPAIMP